MDLRSPYVVSVSDVVSGTTKQLDLVLPALEEWGVGLIGIPEGSEVKAYLTLQSVSEGIFVQGNVVTVAYGQCSRCARDITQPMDEAVAELVFGPSAVKHS